MDELRAEGVVQILATDLRGESNPVMAAVGVLQFEVVQARMRAEYNVETVVGNIPYTRWRGALTPPPRQAGRRRGVDFHPPRRGTYCPGER